MRSVRDTFIINRNKTEDRMMKIFSFVYGVKDLKRGERYRKIEAGSCAVGGLNIISGLTALGILVFKYTGREQFCLTYRMEKERGIDFCIRPKSTAAEILGDVVNRMEDGREPVYQDALDILLDFSDAGDDPETDEYHMVLRAKAAGGKIRCSVFFKESVYCGGYARQIAEQWLMLLQKRMSEDTKKLDELRLESEEERLARWNTVKSSAEDFSYEYRHSIVEEFYQGFRDHADDTALSDTEGKMTYRQLDQISNRIANMLRLNGVAKGDHVAIVGERSRSMILSILGTLKLGAVYIPIDMELPVNRIRYIMQDAMVKKTLLLERVRDLEEFENAVTLDSIDDYPEEFVNEQIGGEDDAYILYTSGTTGNPKGVIVKHESVVNLSKWFGDTYNLKKNRHVLHMTNMSFDVSVEETITTLLNFAEIHLIPQNIRFNKQEFAAYLTEHKIAIAQFVPVTLKELLGDTKKIDCLKVVICGGERLDDDLKNDMLRKGYDLFNHYGPTECTVDAVTCKCEPASNNLGRPIANTEVYVIDSDNELQMFGAVGELCISGAGMSRGYFRKKEMTEEKFTWIPSLNKKVYRTGDLAVMMPDGNLRFVGRSDHQVKINGLRIELEEIECHLKRYAGIEEAVVTVITNHYGGRALCAYYKSTASVNYKNIKIFLGQFLPQYMIPNHYILIEEWPVTVNGKIDKNLLSKWESSIQNRKYEAPVNKAEREISDVWKKILGHPRISVVDEFINVGGDSLRAVILSNVLSEKYNLQIPLNSILTSTVRQTAKLLNQDTAKEVLPKDDNLILLKSGSDTARHVFFVHAGNGEAEAFIDLCDGLSVDSYLWGIRADRLADYSPRNVTLSEIACHYVKKLEKVQPEGEIQLIGWCIGGSIAFEMALQLEQKGRTLGFFGMINSFAPDREFWDQVPAFSLYTEAAAIKKLPRSEAFKKLYGKPESISGIWLCLLEYYDMIGLSAEELKKCVDDDMDRAIPYYDSANVTVRHIVYYINVLRTFDNARALYVPTRRLRAQAHFFAAAEETAANIPVWNQYCEKPMQIHEIRGSNFSALQYPKVQEFSELLNKMLSV